MLILNFTEPPSIYDMKQEVFVHSNRALVAFNWTASGHFEECFVAVSPSLTSGAIFNTRNTSLLLPIMYNQEYHISVVAYNCAGNSTVNTSVILGKFNLSN